MQSKLKEINSVYKKACSLKEIARKSPENIDVFLQAAELFHKAGFLKEEFAKDNDIGSINSIHSKIFSSYYYYEEHNCFAQYYYEKHDIDKAKEHNKESLNFLEGSIKLTEENIKSLTSQIKEQLSDHLKICKYYKITSIALGYNIDARFAWDNSDYVKALDFYRQTKKTFKEAVVFTETNSLAPIYRRISKGNYIGMIANSFSAFAGILFKSFGSSDNKIRSIPNSLIPRLLKYAFEGYRYSNEAFNENPECKQYNEGAQVCLSNIKKVLEMYSSRWLNFYIEFENEPEFIKIMKTTDIKRFKEVEDERYFRENKYAKLWAVGSFLLFSILVIMVLVTVVVRTIRNWETLLIVFFVGVIIFVIVGAFLLKSTGDLSESGFLKLVSLALKYLKSIFKLFK